MWNILQGQHCSSGNNPPPHALPWPQVPSSPSAPAIPAEVLVPSPFVPPPPISTPNATGAVSRSDDAALFWSNTAFMASALTAVGSTVCLVIMQVIVLKAYRRKLQESSTLSDRVHNRLLSCHQRCCCMLALPSWFHRADGAMSSTRRRCTSLFCNASQAGGADEDDRYASRCCGWCTVVLALNPDSP